MIDSQLLGRQINMMAEEIVELKRQRELLIEAVEDLISQFCPGEEIVTFLSAEEFSKSVLDEVKAQM